MLDTNALVRLIVGEDPVNVEKAEAFTVPPSGGETTSVNTTVIRNAAWIAAWDGGGHRYFRDGDVAFAGNRIVHVGGPYEGPADRSIDGSRRFVMPGLVNVHSHPHTEPAFKGVREDHGVPEMYDTGLYECSAPPPWAGPALSDVTISAGWRRARRRTSCSSTSTIPRCALRGTRCARSCSRRRTGRSATSSSTDDRRSRTGSPCISTRIEPRTNSKSPRRGCSRMHPGATSSAAPGTRSRPIRFPFESHTIRAQSHLFRAGADLQSQPM